MDFSVLRDIDFLVTRDNIKIPFRVENIRTEYGGYLEINGLIIGSPSNFERKQLKIERVIFNDPATIVVWSDKTKTVVKCQPGDMYDKEKGLALCICKKFFGNKGNFNEIFKKYIPADEEKKQADEEYKPKISVEDMREQLKTFCRSNTCKDCVFYCDACKCGRGKSLYEGEDDEIIRRYRVAYEDMTDLIKPIRVEVINAKDGAHCADGLVGVLLPIGSKKSHNGLLESNPHLLFEADNGIVYRISKKSDLRWLI